MRIPHTIDTLAKEVYDASIITIKLKDEFPRKIRPGVFVTYVTTAEKLSTLCLNEICKNFEDFPIYEELSQHDRDHLVEILTTELPLTLVIPIIDANPVVKGLYDTSFITLRLKDEFFRKIKAGIFCTYITDIDTLSILCLKTIVTNFEKYPIYEELLQIDKEYLVENLSADVPLTWAIPNMNIDFYWKRRYKEHFGAIVEYKHIGATWKCLYLERYVRKICEEAEPQYKDEFDHDDILQLCEPYIHILVITQLQHWSPSRLLNKSEIPTTDAYPINHIDFTPILKYLQQLGYIEICFGMNNRGLDYDPHCYKVDPRDLENIAQAIKDLTNVTSLKIHRSNIGCEHIKKFVRVSIHNPYITELDFSFCKIKDIGGKCLGKLITVMVNLRILILRGNQIGKDGIHGIAYALQEASSSSSLYTLDLSLNPLGTDGITLLCSALMRSLIPIDLRLSGVGLEGEISVTVAAMLKYNKSLRELDLTLNEITYDAAKNVVTAIQKNNRLTKIDLRHTGVEGEILDEINSLLSRNAQLYAKEIKEEESRGIKSWQSSTSFISEYTSVQSNISDYK